MCYLDHHHHHHHHHRHTITTVLSQSSSLSKCNNCTKIALQCAWSWSRCKEPKVGCEQPGRVSIASPPTCFATVTNFRLCSFVYALLGWKGHREEAIILSRQGSSIGWQLWKNDFLLAKIANHERRISWLTEEYPIWKWGKMPNVHNG